MIEGGSPHQAKAAFPKAKAHCNHNPLKPRLFSVRCHAQRDTIWRFTCRHRFISAVCEERQRRLEIGRFAPLFAVECVADLGDRVVNRMAHAVDPA
jgi:hypothetical protein